MTTPIDPRRAELSRLYEDYAYSGPLMWPYYADRIRKLEAELGIVKAAPTAVREEHPGFVECPECGRLIRQAGSEHLYHEAGCPRKVRVA